MSLLLLLQFVIIAGVMKTYLDAWAYGKEKIRGAERNLPDFFGLCPTTPEKIFEEQINFGDLPPPPPPISDSVPF